MPAAQADDPRLKRLSDCLSLAQIAPVISLYCPLAAPPELLHVQLSQGSRFRTSAVCAVLTHQATLPTRLQRGAAGACDLHSLVQLLVRLLSISATCCPWRRSKSAPQ